MLNILNDIKNNINKNYVILLVGGAVYIIGVILGLILPSTETSSALFYSYAENYYCSVLSIDASPFSTFLTRILNSILVLILTALLCSNIYTFFLAFIILLYRGFIIGYVFILFILSLGFNGIITYLFLVLIQNVIISFAILLFMVNIYGKVNCSCNNLIKTLLNYLITSFIICLIGCLIEFILLTCLFRPLNLYF